MADDDLALRHLLQARWRRALALTAVMVVVYFGFIALTAWAKALMARPLVGGLSVGILLGAVVIVTAFALTGAYVRWANAHYDPALQSLRERARAKAKAP